MSRSPSRGRHRVRRGRSALPRRARPPDGRDGGSPGRGGRRPLVVLATAVFLVAGTGAAVAAWVTTGSGSAAGQATSAQDVVIAAGTPAAELYPGGSGSVQLTVTNPNPYPVRLSQASFGTVTAAPSSGRTCADAAVEPVSTGPVTLGTPVDLAAGAASVPLVIPNALRMLSTAENGCQDATFTVAVTLTGTST